MQKVTYNVNSRPTKETPGQTDVINTKFDSDGAETEVLTIGSLIKTRGTDGVVAHVLDGEGNSTDLGSFDTRSGGGHAVQRAYFADDIAARKQAVVDANAEKAQGVTDRKAAREQAKLDKANEAPAAPVSDEQAKKDEKNAKRRAARLLAKQNEEAA